MGSDLVQLGYNCVRSVWVEQSKRFFGLLMEKDISFVARAETRDAEIRPVCLTVWYPQGEACTYFPEDFEDEKQMKRLDEQLSGVKAMQKREERERIGERQVRMAQTEKPVDREDLSELRPDELNDGGVGGYI